MPLDATDLAYMRETQADHRPTQANLAAATRTQDNLGGYTLGFGADQPVMVRIDTTPDEIPADIAGRYEGGSIVMLTMDLVQVNRGDRLTVSATEVYMIISSGETDPWATAQQVWAHRTT